MASKDIAQHLLSPLAEVGVGDGDDQKVYHLHISLLCEVSQYFRGSLKGSFEEASSRKVSLTDLEPDAFRWFVKWLYTGEIAPFESDNAHSAMEVLVKLYLIGDRLLCSDLKNRTIDMMQDACTLHHLSVDALIHFAESDCTESMMASYLVKQMAYDMVEGHELDSYIKDKRWPEFLATDGSLTSELFLEMMRLKKLADDHQVVDDPQDVEGCRWHGHEGNEDRGCERWPEQARGIEWAYNM